MGQGIETDGQVILPRFCLILSLLLAGPGIWASSAGETSDRVALEDRFPKPLLFRQDLSGRTSLNYETWRDSLLNGVGTIKKIVAEELLTLNPNLPRWFARYRKEHPESLLLMHFNGEARQTHTIKAVHQRYFPGHWVYLPGTDVLEAVSEGKTSFNVGDASPFSMEAYWHPRRPERRFPHDAVLVQVDENGGRLWQTAEYVQLQAIEHEAGRVRVKRGQYFSKQKSFPAGRTVLLPLEAGVWGGRPMWYYNLSTACPEDSDGKTAAQRLSEELTQWFEGPLQALDGIAFDVVHWEARRPEWDMDNDGLADGGRINGRHILREGSWDFLTLVRNALGDERIIIADGHLQKSQRALGILDGIEFEGAVKHNDGFRSISTRLNFNQYWQKFNSRNPTFHYTVLKLRNPQDMLAEERLTRFGYGLATVLGGAAGLLTRLDDYSAGWLGRPASGLKRPVLETENILTAGKRAGGEEWYPNWQAEGGRADLHPDGVLRLSGDAGDHFAPIVASVELPDHVSGDIVVSFEVRSESPLSGFSETLPIPRVMRAQLEGVPDFGEGKLNQEMYTSAMAMVGHREFMPVSFYFRNSGGQKRSKVLKLTIEEQAGVLLRNLKLHAGADLLARRFEQGVVLVNPALSTQKVNLQTLFPGIGALRTKDGGEASHWVSVPAVDAVFLKK